MIRTRALLLALVALTAFGLAACGSSSGDAKSTDTTASSSKTTEADSTGDASSEIDNFASDLQKGKNVTFDATYQSTQSGSTESSTFRVAQKKPKSLFETTSGDSTTTVISDGTDTFICSKSGTEAASCIKSPSGSGSNSVAAPMLALVDAGNITTSLRALDRVPGINVDRSTKTLAGEKATCVSVHVRGNGSNNDGTWCVIDAGVIAYIESGGSTIELTEFTTDVGDSTFDLPADVQSY